MIRLVAATFLILPLSSSFQVENGVVGSPNVQCGIDNIVVSINTEKPLKGRIYVQGEAENPQCMRSATNGPFDHPQFDLPIGTCNMRRQRSLHPRGVVFSFTLVVSFHPLFVTGIDRAFNVRCFFLESVKSLNTKVDVGILTTEVLEQEFSLPMCLYQLKDGLEGPSLKFAQVGQEVTHLWHCDDSVSLVYGILIHSCFADDGQGNKFQLVDDRGCSTDPWLLPQIQYQANKISAFTNAQVFKYADKIQLFFSCTIQLCYKHDGGCEEITPPKCGTSQSDVLRTSTDLTAPSDTSFKIPTNENIPNIVPQNTLLVHPSQNSELGPKLDRPKLDFFSPTHPHTKHEDTPEGQLGRNEYPSQEPFKEPIPNRAFFGPMSGTSVSNQIRSRNEKEIDFLQTPYKDSPINETDSDDIQTSQQAAWMTKMMEIKEPVSPPRLTRQFKPNITISNPKLESVYINKTASHASGERLTKKRRDLDMETDLHVDVIVLPFEDKKRSTRTLNFSPVEVCASRTVTILIFSIAILTTIICSTVTFLLTKRCTVHHGKEIDAFN